MINLKENEMSVPVGDLLLRVAILVLSTVQWTLQRQMYTEGYSGMRYSMMY